MNKYSVFRHPAVRTLVFVMISSLAGFASVIGTFDRSFQVSGPVDLEVLTRSGDITIRTGSSGSVSIHAKIHSGNSWFSGDNKPEVQELQNNPPIRQNGNSIRIDYVNLRNISVDYEITVPEDTTVRAHTGSGDQTVEGLRGNTDLESGSGDLRLARLTGDLHFQTGSGNVRGSQISGPARGKAGSGDIRGEGTPKNLWSIRTGSGNVTLRVPSDLAFDVDVSTSSGSVTMGHPVTTTIQGRVQESRKSIVGKVRGGGPTISVHTGSGDIHVQ